MIISQKASNIYKKLIKTYLNPVSALNFTTEVEVWAAVILSAQCTDKRVNIVTSKLFKKYKTFKDYMDSDIDELKELIHSTGFFNAKAKYLKLGAKKIVEKYHSKLPKSLKELTSLPGIGRKVGNVIQSEWFKINEGIAIDTHNKRLAIRIGLTTETNIHKANVEKIEKELVKLFPKKNWNKVSLLLVEHGRAICKARKPLCSKCVIKEYCNYYKTLNN